MAYDTDNLNPLSYTNGFTLWHYRTQDKEKDILSDGYFDDTKLAPGDAIIINFEEDGIIKTKMHSVDFGNKIIFLGT